ncbi:ABC transporter ATP-binding protein [Nocardiopsis sp. RSe5-2]|uniref:ABC transporter ATP-binding protein n=1 Tax=Nocardiopsis endophytica TaxID=3018445 RepID=A0ABT4TWM8_9ACTN|nr:ABC transporter ATP-binding protein [Nocardiopsis endophytica]MDA2809114.1 ABC transporter ATP-binding protein [Nocardiopsis endophytica]
MTLEVSELRVHYRTLRGSVQALDGASLEVGDGEVMGVVGESGCGKSTLGKSLIRMDGRMRHVGGSVRLGGEELPIGDDRAMQRFRFHEVSLIPQYAMSALNPTRRIGRMIGELLESRGVRYAEVRRELERRLELVGLGAEVLKRYPIELSGGMKQRVVLVLSTLRDPAVLIADEATSALDVANQRAVAEALVGFRDRGFIGSMLFITHDLALVAQLADTVTVMYAGRSAESAPVSELLRRPRHPYTRMLLSAVPEVGTTIDEHRQEGIPGSPPALLDPPPGCRFKDRCPLAFEQCETRPPFVEVAPGHRVACWKAE